MSKAAFKILYEKDVDFYKQWLRDKEPLILLRGLSQILRNNSDSSLKERQISRLETKLIENSRFAGSLMSVVDAGIVTVDGIVTLEANSYDPDILYYHIRSRPQFVKLIYQYISDFPAALYEAYTELTGENLTLDDLSKVREFYEHCSTFDSWTCHQLCAYISHSDPEALDCLSADPKTCLPRRLSRIFSRPDLYEENLPLVKAAVLGGALEVIHLDRDHWKKKLA